MLQESVIDDPVLVVDLDGTLLRSDILLESFWEAIRGDWRVPISCALHLARGRAHVKRYLADSAELDCTNLPYNLSVISYIEAWRARGGRTALVTASDQDIAEQIARHLRLFDEVYGSDGRLNLKGKKKAVFLREKFAGNGFAYMGDSSADLAVWQEARQAITVNVSARLRHQVDEIGCQTEHLETSRSSVGLFIKAMRPHQWLKNALVFLPMLAAHDFAGETLLRATLGFIAFCLVASSVYVLNDLLDLNSDRAHPRKRYRPFASGSVSLVYGTLGAPLLLLTGVAIAVSIGSAFGIVMFTYYIMTIAYSFGLKRRIIIDICVLALLYTLRIVAGAAATSIALSFWLLAFSVFFFFSLASIKRQAELTDLMKRGALSATGRGYHVDDLPIVSMMALVSGYVSVAVMALYVNSSAVIQLYKYPFALWGVCIVLLYWISSMVMVTHRGGMHDDPLVYAAKDRRSQICAVVILGLAIAGMVL